MQRNAISSPHARKPRGLGHERRGEILAAARELFLTEGFETVTTRKLAERAGLSQTGLYVYFQGKEEILRALCHEAFDGLVERIQRAARETELGPGRLRAIIKAYIVFALQYPDEYQIVFMSRAAGTPFAEPKDLSLPFEEQPPGLQAFLICREQVAQLSAAGFLKPIDVSVAAQTIWMACHGLVALLIARPAFPWADRQALIDSMADTLVAGLQPPSKGKKPLVEGGGGFSTRPV